MKKFFIFDFDGVIADSFKIAVEEINRLGEQQFAELPRINTREDMAQLYPGPLRTSLRQFGLSDADCRRFFHEHLAAMASRAGEIEPFSDVLAAINRHAAGRCAIVTSAYSTAVEAILNKCSNYEPGMIGRIMGRELQQSKSLKIDTVLKQNKVERSNVIHFGDLVSDLIYSREVEVPFCAVGWGYHPVNYLRAFDPQFSLNSPGELEDFLAAA